MFETSVVRARALPPRRRFALITASVIAHSAAIAGAVAMSIASVDFPATAPDEVSSAPVLMPIQIPPPLGRPDGDGRAEATPPAPKQPQTTPAEITAPESIPESVAPAEGPSVASGAAESGEASGAPGPLGVPWGVEGSPGELDAPPSTIAPPPAETKIYQPGGGVTSPVVLVRVEPVYPPVLLQRKVPGTAVIRCIIDRNGRVRDPQVVTATLPPFGEAALKAVTQWRFTPASLRGEAVECWFHLTVNFGVR